MIEKMGMVATRECPISVADLLLLSITCLQNLYYAAIYLIPTTLETLKISLLFPCHEPVTIEIASATAGLFCGTVYPLMYSADKQSPQTSFRKLLTSSKVMKVEMIPAFE